MLHTELATRGIYDIQQPENSRVQEKIVQDFGGDGEAWARWVYGRGFRVYETFVERGRKEIGEGKYSVGDEVSFADLFLVPAVQGGLRVGVELGKWPGVKGIVNLWMSVRSWTLLRREV